MYYPYIRAKQFDLSAINELNTEICNSSKIIPIIEPVTKIKISQYNKLAQKEIPFVLVVNPIVGKLSSTTPHNDIHRDLISSLYADNDNCTLGFIIQPTTTVQHVNNFIRTYTNHAHAFIHFHEHPLVNEISRIIENDINIRYNFFIDGRVGIDYINSYLNVQSHDILIRDGFKKRKRNEDYPTDEFFSDLHRTYEHDGYNGFGDFTIIGEQFEEGGGPAYVVALHLTDKDNNDNLRVRHFKSSTTPPITTTDPGGKFRQALRLLKRHVDGAPYIITDGVNEYIDLYHSGHFPGLGIPKKISIKHHIEFMHSIL